MSERASSDEISLDRHAAAIWRYKWLMIAAVVLAAGATAGYGLTRPVLYSATADIETGMVWKEPLEDLYRTAETANGSGFLRQTSERASVSFSRLKSAVRVQAVTGGPSRARYPILIRVTATTLDPGESETLATAVAETILERHESLFQESMAPRLARQDRLESRIDQLRSSNSTAALEVLARIESELDEVRANNSSPTLTRRSRLAQPVVAGGPVRLPIWRRVAIVGLIAAVAAAALVILAANSTSISSRSPAE